MDTNDLQARIGKIEQELNELKQIQEGRRKNWRRIVDFLLKHWSLLSFISAIGIIFYVQFAFGVDYFESYRNIADAKKLSNFYADLGDSLIRRESWSAAEEAYKMALEYNKYNSRATLGVAKAQIFQPSPGETYVDRDVVNTKLDFLIELFPKDADLYLMKGYSYYNVGDRANAIKYVTQATELNPECGGCFISLGFYQQQDGNTDLAKQSFQTAVNIDPNNLQANNNLGFILNLSGQFQEAKSYFEKSWSQAPTFLTSLNLADASTYSNDYQRAVFLRNQAIRITINQSTNMDRFLGNEWLYSYLPIYKDDQSTIKKSVIVRSKDEKLAFAYYGLSIDMTLSGDLDQASAMLQKAFEYDANGAYKDYFSKRIKTAKSFLSLDSNTIQALDVLDQQLK